MAASGLHCIGSDSRAELGEFFSQRMLPWLRSRGETAREDDETRTEALVNEWESLRFRILSVGLHAGASPSDEVGVPVTETGGIVHAPVGRSLIILLPKLETNEQGAAAAQNLLSLSDTPRGQRAHWILDFSSMTAPPPVLFIGFITALKRDLARYGCLLTVAWMRSELFPAAFMGGVIRSLDLTAIGGFLFSKQQELQRLFD